jgi:hypothetical protein
MSVPINNVPRRVVYAASGTGPYNFSFEILAATDIAVYRDDTLLTLTTDYTVTINTNGTGSVTLVADPAPATQIAIVGNRTIQRLSDFVTGGDFFANTLNNELDQQTIFAQQNAEGLGRALSAPQTDPLTINMVLPRAADRAGKTLNFDSNGNPVAGLAVVATASAAVATWLATPSSANLAAAVTDETGTGALVFATNPTLSGIAVAKDGAGYEASMLSFRTITETGAIYRFGMATGGAFAIGRADTNTTNITLDSSGNVGIGTTDTANAFVTLTKNNAVLRINPGSGGATIQSVETGIAFRNLTISSAITVFDIAGVEAMRINAAGEFLIGTTTDNGAYLLQVNSQIWATNATIATSDARLKENVAPISGALDTVKALQPVTFGFKQDTGYNFDAERQTGFIAQDLQTALAGQDYADCVVKECGPYLGVAYEKLIPVLTKAIQEQQAIIEQLTQRIAALEQA